MPLTGYGRFRQPKSLFCIILKSLNTMNQPKISFWLKPETHRNSAAAVAAVGSVLLLLNWPAQNVAAFIGIIVLFMAAFVAMAGVMAALKHHRIGLVVQCLLLMMWSVLLPLVLLSRAVM